MNSVPTPLRSRNRLLAAVSPETYAALRPHLAPVELPMHRTLHPVNEPISDIYFPETGWVSMLAQLEDGDSAEVGLIGREGMVGIPVLLGAEADDLEAMVQNPGAALRMDAGSFRAAVDRFTDFRTLLLRYALVHHAQVARTAACNGRHGIESRLARWLLMAHDRAEGDGFAMTHELLSYMLGVRRAGITVAAGALRRAGLIAYESGRVEVTDRPGLEAASCECYEIVRRASDTLLGPLPGAPSRPDKPRHR